LRCTETLTFTLSIQPIRIAHIIVDEDENNILGIFTLSNAPPRAESMKILLKESSLYRLIECFTSIIDSNHFAFRASSLNIRYCSTEQVWKTTSRRITE